MTVGMAQFGLRLLEREPRLPEIRCKAGGQVSHVRESLLSKTRSVYDTVAEGFPDCKFVLDVFD